MLLVIHNFPSSTRYNDVKSLIQTHCGLSNVILDNLMSEGIHKKVTVGVADDADAARVRKLNGMLLAGKKLLVEDMRNNNEKSYNSNKSTTRWSQPHQSNNPPSLMGQSTFSLGQDNVMLGQNNAMTQNNMMMGLASTMRQDNSMMGQNSLLMRQNNTLMSQNSGMMGQNASMMRLNSPMMGQNNTMGQSGQIAPLMGPNNPVMVPPPLMAYPAQAPFSGPFYMSPQNNDYGNPNSGQQSVSQYPDQTDNAPSKKYGFPDTGSRRNIPDKSIPVWASDDSNNYGSRGYSGNDRERYDSRQASSSRRTKWDASQGQNESMGTRDVSKRPKPWADDSALYRRGADYESSDRSYDRGQNRYSRRQDNSGASAYQRRPYEGSSSGSKYRDSVPGSRKGSSRYDLRSREGRSPPPKRFRANYTEPNYKSGPSSTDKKPGKKLSLQKIVERDLVWRRQAAAEIVKDMFTKLKTNSVVPQNVVFHKMKTAVRNRLLIILNNRLEVKLSDQMVLYRRRFRAEEDQCLYNRVIRHILHDQQLNPTESKAEDNAADVVAVQPPVKKPAKTVVKLAPAPVEQVVGRLPKYPQGNKAAYQLQKQQFKKEFQLQSDPELDPATKKAIDEEMEAIKDIILSESINPRHDGESMFCKRIAEPEVMGEMKQMIALNVTKRILNLGTVPLIRILGQPKVPRKAPLEEYLRTRGVMSLKKSDRKPMYIATCNSYESFDNLCALKDVVIDNVKVLFKPMYLTAPLEKVKHKKKNQKGNTEITETSVEKIYMMDDNNTAVKAIKQEIVTPVKNKASGETSKCNTLGIKNEPVTPTINKGAGGISTEIKHEDVTPVESAMSGAEPAAENKELAMTDFEEFADDSYEAGAETEDYIENVYGDYSVEDSTEVNEDDLEDY